MIGVVQHISTFLPMIERTDSFPSSFATIGLLVAFILFCFLFPRGKELFFLFFRSYWEKETRVNFDSNQNNFLLKFVFLLGTFTCYGFFVFRLLNHQFIYEVPNWIYVCSFSLLFFAAFWVKIAIVYSLGYVFGLSKSVSLFVKEVISLFSLNFLVLFPLLILYLFVVGISSFFWLNMVVAVALLSFILLFIKLFRLFFQGFSSLFYIFLYLCALEILPIFLIIKVISDEFLIVKF